MGLGVPARASWMLPPAPYRPKDFAVVKKDGVYHLFYIRRNVLLPAELSEYDLGHAVSRDLVNWSQEPAVLLVRGDQWDNQHVWAPSIVLRDSTYTMFYCGVTSSPGTYDEYQRIGIATSTDLYDWTRYDQPVFACPQVPWCYCDSLSPIMGFRDPFVMPDPNTPGRWLMYYTANVATDTAAMVVGVAASDGDFTQWTDVEPLWITYRPTPTDTVAESPHVFQHDGLWYLFRTMNGSQPIVMTTSPDPVGAIDSWTPRGSLGAMLGINTASRFASEYFRDGLLDYFFCVNADRIEYYRMVWTGVAQFTFYQPDPFHVTNMTWMSDTVTVGQSATVRLSAVNWRNRTADLDAVAVDAGGHQTSVLMDSLALVSHLPILQDTTVVQFTARLWPAGQTGPTRWILRTLDQTAGTSRALVVLPEVVPPIPSSLPLSQPPWSDDEGLLIKILRKSSVSGTVEFLVDQREASPARLEIFDSQGRRRAVLVDRGLGRGAHVVAWDGRDMDGRRAGAGIYFARLTTARARAVARCVLLH